MPETHLMQDWSISTHAPAGGATSGSRRCRCCRSNFYSRPCGRGDGDPVYWITMQTKFLLTPLREGRHEADLTIRWLNLISTHAPAGGAT